MITAIDDIMFEDVEMGDGTKGTKITYQADISLNHIFCCCQCLIRGDLEQLAKNTEEGMKKKCRELFGKECC